MSWAAVWALTGLAALPVLWFLHRRRRRPQSVDLPSLIFLLPEPTAVPARRQALDPELWLSFVAVALLVGAAAGPFLTTRAEGRTVALVVSGGSPATARGYRERVEAVQARIEASLSPTDRLTVLEEPRSGAPLAPRPRRGALLAAAHAQEAAWRVVVTDAAPPEHSEGVTWASVGAPAAFNVGIVTSSLSSSSAGFELFVGVRGDASRVARLRLVVRDRGGVLAEQPLEIKAGGHVSHVFAIGRIGLAFSAALEAPDGGRWSDDLAADDVVEYERTAVRVYLDPTLPRALRHAVEDGLAASLGSREIQETTRDVQLLVAPQGASGKLPEAPWRLVLHPAPDAGALRAPPGLDRLHPDAVVRDLSTSGTDLVYDPAAVESVVAPLTPLLWREAGGRDWPVVARSGPIIHFLPDPTRGRRAPAETPLWPLFLDDLVREVAGDAAAGGAGYRQRGLLDDASSALGRSEGSWDVPDLSARSPDVQPETRSLRPLLVAGALLALLLLWIVPWSGEGTRRGARRHAVPSAHGDPVSS